ncbi:hypothetical protein [Nocardioides euryhalodurans]|uniref:Uncharacterized protein n=1 Tax=Nocardioides euryhalodurans TaxID=2518370 RepID=A0A4P7GM29_9ACTN|nr:hypothetical protein [Nocardioides euryhalodurans]QBR92914.1 hypothetical protein EXE57_12015 [Nocardioides euryhalodurans]
MPEPLQFDAESGEEPDAAAPDADAEPTRVIVKVCRPGYVPEGFTVRARVDDVLFTAEASASAVLAARDDPEVEAIEHSRPLSLDEE